MHTLELNQSFQFARTPLLRKYFSPVRKVCFDPFTSSCRAGVVPQPASFRQSASLESDRYFSVP
jgi:hypothetical protein